MSSNNLHLLSSWNLGVGAQRLHNTFFAKRLLDESVKGNRKYPPFVALNALNILAFV